MIKTKADPHSYRIVVKDGSKLAAGQKVILIVQGQQSTPSTSQPFLPSKRRILGTGIIDSIGESVVISSPNFGTITSHRGPHKRIRTKDLVYKASRIKGLRNGTVITVQPIDE